MQITEKNRKWWILFAMTSCISMIFIDVTVLPVALPTIERQFNASPEALQWIINGYTLVLCVLVLAGGKIGDIWGHRRAFCFGLIVFAAASALCGLSIDMNTFIASRALQGVGGAVLIPTTTAILFSCFPPHERGRALGYYVSGGSIFLAIGPFIGGSLTQYASWRMIFYLNLPIALLGFILAILSVPKSEGKKQPFDYVGFFTLASGITAITIGLMQGSVWGWTSPLTLSMFLFGIGSISILIFSEREIEYPLIDFKLYKKKAFLGASTSIFFNQLQLGVTVFWAIYLQNALGYSPSTAGVLSLISNLPLLFMAPLAGYLVDKYGPRIPVVIGFIILCLSLGLFIINPTPSLSTLLLIMLPYGCGIPLIFTPSFTCAMAQAHDEKRGMVSAMITTVRQFSTTLGIALFTALLVTKENGSLSSLLKSHPATENINPDTLEGIASKTPAALEVLHSLPQASASLVEGFAKQAYISAFTFLNSTAGLFSLLGLLLSLFLLAKTGPIHKSKA